MQQYNIKQIFSQPYKPTSQGTIERFNQTLKKKIFKFMTLYSDTTHIFVDIVNNNHEQIMMIFFIYFGL